MFCIYLNTDDASGFLTPAGGTTPWRAGAALFETLDDVARALVRVGAENSTEAKLGHRTGYACRFY